jgi:hypothetical protein
VLIVDELVCLFDPVGRLRGPVFLVSRCLSMVPLVKEGLLVFAGSASSLLGLFHCVDEWPFGHDSVVFNGEFDPGSGRTLAACLTHASRAVRPFGVHERRTGE